jgi:hypothetical protein
MYEDDAPPFGIRAAVDGSRHLLIFRMTMANRRLKKATPSGSQASPASALFDPSRARPVEAESEALEVRLHTVAEGIDAPAGRPTSRARSQPDDGEDFITESYLAATERTFQAASAKLDSILESAVRLRDQLGRSE